MTELKRFSYPDPPAPAGGAAPMTGATGRARLVLAEDDVLLREGLTSLLEGHGFEVAGQAGNDAELLELVREHRPDVIVVDIRMPPTHTTEGLDAALQIRREYPDAGVLVLSAHVEVEQATELLGETGGVGYLLKSRVMEVDELLDALERVAAGRAAIDPALVRELVAVQRRSDPLDELSAREREVLTLMAEGLSNGGIARRLWLACGTVEKYVKSILFKLDIPTTEDDHRRVLAVLAYLAAR
jgi:DNA-binding NarL/FixJ family response regulator